MKASTFCSVSMLRFRAWLVAAIVLSLITGATSVSAQLPAYYSTSGPTNLVTTGGTITAGANASAGALSTFATVQVNGLSS